MQRRLLFSLVYRTGREMTLHRENLESSQSLTSNLTQSSWSRNWLSWGRRSSCLAAESGQFSAPAIYTHKQKESKTESELEIAMACRFYITECLVSHLELRLYRRKIKGWEYGLDHSKGGAETIRQFWPWFRQRHKNEKPAVVSEERVIEIQPVSGWGVPP